MNASYTWQLSNDRSSPNLVFSLVKFNPSCVKSRYLSSILFLFDGIQKLSKVIALKVTNRHYFIKFLKTLYI